MPLATRPASRSRRSRGRCTTTPVERGLRRPRSTAITSTGSSSGRGTPHSIAAERCDAIAPAPGREHGGGDRLLTRHRRSVRVRATPGKTARATVGRSRGTTTRSREPVAAGYVVIRHQPVMVAGEPSRRGELHTAPGCVAEVARKRRRHPGSGRDPSRYREPRRPDRRLRRSPAQMAGTGRVAGVVVGDQEVGLVGGAGERRLRRRRRRRSRPSPAAVTARTSRSGPSTGPTAVEVVGADEELVVGDPEPRIVGVRRRQRIELGGVLAHRHVAGLRPPTCDCASARRQELDVVPRRGRLGVALVAPRCTATPRRRARSACRSARASARRRCRRDVMPGISPPSSDDDAPCRAPADVAIAIAAGCSGRPA